MRVAPGAGRKLARSDLIVNQFVNTSHDDVQVASARSDGSHMPPLLVLRHLGSIMELVDGLQVYEHVGGLRYAIKDLDTDDAFPSYRVEDLVTSLVTEAAFDHRGVQHWASVKDEAKEVALELQRKEMRMIMVMMATLMLMSLMCLKCFKCLSCVRCASCASNVSRILSVLCA